MPKYTLSGEQAAIILPVNGANGMRKRLVNGETIEVSDAEHAKLSAHRVVKAFIDSGVITVDGAKSLKPDKTPEELKAEAEAKEQAKKIKTLQTALTKKGIEFDKDATLEQLEALVAQSEA